jgi:hypothetical protein
VHAQLFVGFLRLLRLALPIASPAGTRFGILVRGPLEAFTGAFACNFGIGVGRFLLVATFGVSGLAALLVIGLIEIAIEILGHRLAPRTEQKASSVPAMSRCKLAPRAAELQAAWALYLQGPPSGAACAQSDAGRPRMSRAPPSQGRPRAPK